MSAPEQSSSYFRMTLYCLRQAVHVDAMWIMALKMIIVQQGHLVGQSHKMQQK